MFLYELILREGKEKSSTSGLVGDGLLALIAGGVTGKIVLLIMTTSVVQGRTYVYLTK